MESENKTCENCKYSRQHYVVGCNGYFVKLCGVIDCANRKITKKQFKINFKNNACQHWEPFDLQEQENDYKIAEQLKFINKRLEKIIQVLESNNLNK